MEFVIATLIAIVALIVAWLTYRSQLVQSFKRLHYSSFITSLVPALNDEFVDLLTIRFDGEDLILPILCVAVIENTGKVPIIPQDFNGPLTIRSQDKAVFRGGILRPHPPNMFDIERPDSLKVNLCENGINIGPTLINPRDRILVAFIADAIPETWKLEVVSRIAGIEEIIHLPEPGKGTGTNVTFTAHPLGIPTKNSLDKLLPNELSLNAFITPVLLDPGEMFGDKLEVAIGNKIIKDAQAITIAISNTTLIPANNATSFISIDFPDTKIVQRIVQADGMTITAGEARRRVRLDGDHKISIRPPRLEKDQCLRVIMIASGKCGKPIVECRNFLPDQAILMRLETNDVIEQNLAQMEPRLLLSNQRMYQLWHKSIKKHPWVKSLLKLDRRPDKDTET